MITIIIIIIIIIPVTITMITAINEASLSWFYSFNNIIKLHWIVYRHLDLDLLIIC